MQTTSSRLPSRQLVLLGIGHTNAHVVRMWGMNPIPDTSLTCISAEAVASYSGMLPAVLARQIQPADMEIDLVRLCSSVGARLITDPVTAIDVNNRSVRFDDRPDVPFDVLSIGIGSVPNLSGVEFSGSRVLAIKPMQSFLQRLTEATEAALAERNGEQLRIAIIGSGAAGTEIAFCLPGFLKDLTTSSYSIQVVSRSSEILSDMTPGARKRVLREFESRGIETSVGNKVVSVCDHVIRLNTGREIQADLVIWATGAVAPELLKSVNLEKDERGFILTDPTLRCVSRRPVFAVGDAGSVADAKIPKAGVYAVRQGPVLWDNLRRVLDDQPLENYRPQKSFLKLLNTGDGSAIGQFKGTSFAGGWVRSLKDRIDMKFMQMYQVSDKMAASMPVMPCKGCGCKVGSDLLSGVVKPMSEFEDAASVSIGQSTVLVSTDFFTPPFEDAYLNGRIAAIHSASDIIAMGAKSCAAVATVVLPEGDSKAQQQIFADLMQGARYEFDRMKIEIVGGHTIEGPRLEIGFTVLGEPSERSLRKDGLQPGDQLLLTKPLGTGVLLAAQMRSLCRSSEYQSMLNVMLDSQAELAGLACEVGAHAATDVTGFGLAGHLVEMLKASQVSAAVYLDQLPLLPGVQRLVEHGVESTLAPSNRSVQKELTISHLNSEQQTLLAAMFDPQTCGGLLIGLSESAADEFIRKSSHGVSRIGEVKESAGELCVLTVDQPEKRSTFI